MRAPATSENGVLTLFPLLATEKILVIDDDQSILRMMRLLLEVEGYSNVITTAEPRRGLELFESAEPALLILDLNMPNLDGFAVMRALHSRRREQLARTPVLMLTGNVSRQKTLQALALGVRDVLVKPFEPVELCATIRANLERRRRLEDITNDLKGA